MGDTITELPANVREKVSALFRDRAPVLAEVRFPRMGTSSDWYLFEAEEDFEQLWRRLGTGVELHLASAWDVEMRRGKVTIQH
jgi:hypothetical protein